MSSKSRTPRAVEDLIFTKVIDGTTTHITTPILLNGQMTSPQSITGTFTAALQSKRDLDAARTATKTKLAARNVAVAAARLLLEALRFFLEAAYGKNSPVLADFGLESPAKVVPTAEAKAAAVAKGAATRLARGTRGKRQKAGIKGVLPAPTPPAAAAGPTASAASGAASGASLPASPVTPPKAQA